MALRAFFDVHVNYDIAGSGKAPRDPTMPRRRSSVRKARWKSRRRFVARAGQPAVAASSPVGRESAIFLALIIIMGVIYFVAPKFMSAYNLFLVSRQISLVAIVAFGELFVITHRRHRPVGGLPRWPWPASPRPESMSTGTSIPCSPCGRASSSGWSWAPSTAALIAYVRSPLHRHPGHALPGLRPGARPDQGLADHQHPERFLPIGRATFLGLPIPLWIAGALAVLVHVVLTEHRLRPPHLRHRRQRAGHLPLRHRRQGDQVPLYMISALAAAIVGIILVARFNSAQADTARAGSWTPSLRPSSAAPPRRGGSGSILGVVIGALHHGRDRQRPGAHACVLLLADGRHRRHHRPGRGTRSASSRRRRGGELGR